MKIISCPLPGKSLIVQFEPAASTTLVEHASRQPVRPSHGLLLGSITGDDPKWLHIHQIQPIFGGSDEVRPAGPKPARIHTDLVTLGYYTIRTDGESLEAEEREFLASSLPASASVAMVVAGKPGEQRPLAEFYLRDAEGNFSATPDHRQTLIAQTHPAVTLLPLPLGPAATLELEAAPPPRRQAGAGWVAPIFGGLAVAAILIMLALLRQPSHPQPAPVKPSPQSAVSSARLPVPDFTLPVKSIRLIQDPPEVSITYPEPSAAILPATAVANAGRSVLVHPILLQAKSQ